LEIDYCNFPDDALYDLENYVWVRLTESKVAKVGITSVHAGLAGKLNKIRFKSIGTMLNRGQSIATIESVKYFGAVRIPLSGRLVAVNSALEIKPKLANDSPYGDGWFAQI
jgi:glycine cleavage system H protein